jgi:hypothetical protein
MVFQISSSESISLSLVLFCLAFRAIPYLPVLPRCCNYGVSDPVYDPEGRLFVVDIVCFLLGYAHHLRGSLKENRLHHEIWSAIRYLDPDVELRNSDVTVGVVWIIVLLLIFVFIYLLYH